MDDSSFDVDQSALAAASARFPAHRLAPEPTPVLTGLGFLAAPSSFGQHAWDENGHY